MVKYCSYHQKQLLSEIWSFLKLLCCFWEVLVVLPVLSSFFSSPFYCVCLALIKSMLWKTLWADLSDQGRWSITTMARCRAQCEHRCYCEIISTLLFLAMADFFLLSNFIRSFISSLLQEIQTQFLLLGKTVSPHLSSGRWVSDGWELDQVFSLW